MTELYQTLGENASFLYGVGMYTVIFVLYTINVWMHEEHVLMHKMEQYSLVLKQHHLGDMDKAKECCANWNKGLKRRSNPEWSHLYKEFKIVRFMDSERRMVAVRG